MLLGVWKNVADLEANINLDELQAILKAARDAEHRRNVFSAALKGIKLDEDKANSKFEEVKRRVEARRRGMTKDELDLREMGIAVVKD